MMRGLSLIHVGVDCTPEELFYMQAKSHFVFRTFCLDAEAQ